MGRNKRKINKLLCTLQHQEQYRIHLHSFSKKKQDLYIYLKYNSKEQVKKKKKIVLTQVNLLPRIPAPQNLLNF